MATNNQLFTSYNYAKLFVYDNRFVTKTYTNSTGDVVTLSRGRIMGTVLATGKTLPQVAAATDGSEMPRGILANDYTVADGASVTVSICVWGKVAQEGVIFNGAETVNTAVRTVSTGGGTIGDLLQANTGITLAPGEDQTFLDNQ
jgi:hypothetical protein